MFQNSINQNQIPYYGNWLVAKHRRFAGEFGVELG
jgi:hypothetical protein